MCRRKEIMSYIFFCLPSILQGRLFFHAFVIKTLALKFPLGVYGKKMATNSSYYLLQIGFSNTNDRVRIKTAFEQILNINAEQLRPNPSINANFAHHENTEPLAKSQLSE